MVKAILHGANFTVWGALALVASVLVLPFWLIGIPIKSYRRRKLRIERGEYGHSHAVRWGK